MKPGSGLGSFAVLLAACLFVFASKTSIAEPAVIASGSAGLIQGTGPLLWRAIIETTDPGSAVIEVDEAGGLIRVPIKGTVDYVFSGESQGHEYLAAVVHEISSEEAGEQSWAVFVADPRTIELMAAGFQLLLGDPSSRIVRGDRLWSFRIESSELERLR